MNRLKPKANLHVSKISQTTTFHPFRRKMLADRLMKMICGSLRRSNRLSANMSPRWSTPSRAKCPARSALHYRDARRGQERRLQQRYRCGVLRGQLGPATREQHLAKIDYCPGLGVLTAWLGATGAPPTLRGALRYRTGLPLRPAVRSSDLVPPLKAERNPTVTLQRPVSAGRSA